jgi:hypothetical protein
MDENSPNLVTLDLAKKRMQRHSQTAVVNKKGHRV